MTDSQNSGLPDLSQAESEAVQRLGEYLLLEQLGEGGMGVVYKALHTEMDRLVALKVLSRGRMADEHAIARFKREMKAAGRLDHPHIVRAYDAREIEGTRVLAMEYVDGFSLDELGRRLGPLPVADACEIIRQAAMGLQHAHEHGLVHRDIKPSNLMLARPDRGPKSQDRDKEAVAPSSAPTVECRPPGPAVKILDLGLARFRESWPADKSMTVAGYVLGTPDYMAPEQVTDSHSVDIRADIYGLGCTLYTLLVGQPPFAGPSHESAFDKMSAHAHETIPSICSVRDDVSEELQAVLDRTLAKSPAQRFATPGELAGALGPLTSGCDLLRLLAEAESASAASETALSDRPIHLALDARTFISRSAKTQSDRPRHTQAIHPAKPAFWRRPWAIIYGLGLIIALCVGVILALLLPRGDGGGTGVDVENQHTHPLPQDEHESPLNIRTGPKKPDLGRFADHANRSRLPEWIILSWAVPGRGKPDLWLFSLDGRVRRRVTQTPDAFDFQPDLSPDGKRIVFVRAASPSHSTAIWMCDTAGNNERKLVGAIGPDDRALSPLWLSDSRVAYTWIREIDRQVRTDLWKIDLDARKPQPVHGFYTALGQPAGRVTDVSPNGKELVVIAQQAGDVRTSDVYLTGPNGEVNQVLWEDADDEFRDAGAIWSADGRKIAWQHHFFAGGSTLQHSDASVRWPSKAVGIKGRPWKANLQNQESQGGSMKLPYSGVGLAQIGADRKWVSRLQPGTGACIKPLAWSPDSRFLLCVKIDAGRDRRPRGTVFLMDDQFQTVRVLFELMGWWMPRDQHVGRVADWVTLHRDAPLPPPDKFVPPRRPWPRPNSRP